MKRTVFRICLLLMAAGTLALTSCRHDRNQPGYAYMPDMYYSVPYDAYSPNPVLTGGITNQLPPNGTIPRGYVPYPYKPKSFEDQKKAGEELINPVPVSPASLSKGKEQYDIYCSMCHGTAGKGDGYLFTAGLFTAKPSVLTDTLVQNKKDGEIYHVITVGSLSGLMGAHGPMIIPEYRWDIIHYVRELGKQK